MIQLLVVRVVNVLATGSYIYQKSVFKFQISYFSFRFQILFFCSNRPAPDRNRGLPARLADPWWLIHGTIRGVSPRHAAAPPGADCQPVFGKLPRRGGGLVSPLGVVRGACEPPGDTYAETRKARTPRAHLMSWRFFSTRRW